VLSFGRKHGETLGGETARVHHAACWPTSWPLAARAQQTAKLPTIGFLDQSTRLAATEWTAAFVQRLRELGRIEDRTITIEYRWGEGREERFAEIAAEFVRLNVDIIVTSGTPAVVAARQATTVIPIVFAAAGDPVGAGLVASLARPGGNVTGLSAQTADLAAKRLEILREVVPGLRRLAILSNVGNRLAVWEMREVQAAASTLRLEVVTLEIQRGEDLAPFFEALKPRADALYVCVDGLLLTNRIRINTLALTARLPMMTAIRDSVEIGGLISYGPNLPELWRRAGDYVDKVLRGAKPADIPVEQPTKFDLAINLTTARARNRRGRAGARALDRALRAFQLARRGDLRRQAPFRHALRIRRSRGEKRGLSAGMNRGGAAQPEVIA
jgi:putative tryptophan/tyrosine transport system substrate-binding protein